MTQVVAEGDPVEEAEGRRWPGRNKAPRDALSPR